MSRSNKACGIFSVWVSGLDLEKWFCKWLCLHKTIRTAASASLKVGCGLAYQALRLHAEMTPHLLEGYFGLPAPHEPAQNLGRAGREVGAEKGLWAELS